MILPKRITELFDHIFKTVFFDNPCRSSQHHGFCMKRKRELREAMEAKIDNGLDRSINAIIGWVRNIFATEQKKADFRPESEDAPMHLLSPVGSSLRHITLQRALDSLHIDGVG